MVTRVMASVIRADALREFQVSVTPGDTDQNES